MNENVQQHAVVIDGAAFAGLSPAERSLEERAAIDSIVKRVPPEHRPEMRRLLEHPQPGSVLSGSNDPEIARLLGVIASLRAAGDAAAAKRQKDEKASQQLLDSGIEVTIALVSTLPADVRARVIRRPDDGGVPLLLLNETAVAGDVGFGLGEAANSRQRFGLVPDKEHSVDYRSKGNPADSTPAQHSAILDRLRSARFWDVPGVGHVRGMRVMTHPSNAS